MFPSFWRIPGLVRHLPGHHLHGHLLLHHTGSSECIENFPGTMESSPTSTITSSSTHVIFPIKELLLVPNVFDTPPIISNIPPGPIQHLPQLVHFALESRVYSELQVVKCADIGGQLVLGCCRTLTPWEKSRVRSYRPVSCQYQDCLVGNIADSGNMNTPRINRDKTAYWKQLLDWLLVATHILLEYFHIIGMEEDVVSNILIVLVLQNPQLISQVSSHLG